MVNLKNLEIYCTDYENIENFQEALNDEEELWIPHHKLEMFFTMHELMKMGRYIDIPARELILIKRSEHNANAFLHKSHRIANEKKKCRKQSASSNEKRRKALAGKKRPKEIGDKISASKKGKSNGLLGKKRGPYKRREVNG